MIPTEMRTRYQPYTLADLVHYLSGEDIAGLSPRQYAHLSRDVITATSELERDHYYQFGVLPDAPAPPALPDLDRCPGCGQPSTGICLCDSAF